MKLLMLYRPVSEFARRVEEYAHDLKAQQQVVAELVNLDSREGAHLAQLYDITQYPAVLVTRDSGELVQLWQGEHLPLMNEVAAYAR